MADSEEDFALAQGQKNWYYGYWDPQEKKFVQFKETVPAENNPFDYKKSGLWNYHFGAGGSWASAGVDFMHPDHSKKQWTAKRWVSDYKGKVKIIALFAKYPDGSYSGDGFVGLINIDSKSVAKCKVKNNNTEGCKIEYSAHVNIDSTVDFITIPGDNSESDHIYFKSIIIKQ